MPLAETPRIEHVDNLNKANNELQSQIDEKNSIIDAVNKERDDARRQLDEYKQWLSDTNNRVGELENLFKEKESELNTVRIELEEQKGVIVKLRAEHTADRDQGEQAFKNSVEELEDMLRRTRQALDNASSSEGSNNRSGSFSKIYFETYDQKKMEVRPKRF